jgi:hypothetical protein
MNDDTVVRAGYGITYNPLPWARPMCGFYPLTIAGSFFNANTFQPFGTLEQGSPPLTGPDLSTGHVPLPLEAAMRTPEPGNVDRGIIQSWNLFIERRLPSDLSADVGYVGTKGDGGYADLDVNAPQEIGGGNAGRPYAALRRQTALNLWGQRLKTRYHALQVALNRPLTRGLLLKGAYTWSKAMNMADEDGWVGLLFNTPSQYERNYPAPVSIGPTTSSSGSSISCRGIATADRTAALRNRSPALGRSMASSAPSAARRSR